MQPIPCVCCLDLDVEAGCAAGWGFAVGWGFAAGWSFASGWEFTGGLKFAACVKNTLGKAVCTPASNEMAYGK